MLVLKESFNVLITNYLRTGKQVGGLQTGGYILPPTQSRKKFEEILFRHFLFMNTISYVWYLAYSMRGKSKYAMNV